MENQEFKSYLVCDNRHGIYCWQLLAKQILQAEADKLCTLNPKCCDMLTAVVNTDPYDDETYWWAIANLDMHWIYESEGVKYHIEESDGDLWAVEEGYSLFSDEY